jgi:hypothetical protein
MVYKSLDNFSEYFADFDAWFKISGYLIANLRGHRMPFYRYWLMTSYYESENFFINL